MRLSSFFAFNPLARAVGLDIGDRSFKLIQLAPKSAGKPGIIAWGSVDVPEGVMAHGEIKDEAGAAACLERLLTTARGRLTAGSVVACLPEEKTFVKIASTEQEATDANLRAAVEGEISSNVPLPLTELYYDFQRVEAGASRSQVMFGAAPKTLVESYAALLDRAGVVPLALEIEATAVSRAIIPDGSGQDTIGVLDIGATRSSLIVASGGILRMSIGIPVSGMAITETISSSLGVGLEAAEKLKRECGLDATRCEDRMWQVLLPLIEDMTMKIRNAVRYFQVAFPDAPRLENLYLCGGGGQFREIDNVLSRKLTIKTQRGNPLCNVDQRLPKGFPADEALQYATAIGLAIRALEETPEARGRSRT